MTSEATTDQYAISTAEEYRALRGDGGQATHDKSMDVIDDHIASIVDAHPTR